MRDHKITICPKGILLLLVLLCGINSFGQPGDKMYDAINIGTYSAQYYTYTDSRNNYWSSGYMNDYGQPGPDVFYKFTVTIPTNISISLCGSSFDTYVHLLDMYGNLVISNDDNGPLCSGSASSISTTISPGTYFIVVEGHGTSTGVYNLAVDFKVAMSPPGRDGANMDNAVVIGNYTEGGTYNYTDTRSNNPSEGYGNNYGQPSDDIYYKVTFSRIASLTISTCGSNFDTYLYLLRGDGSLVQSSDDNGPQCSGTQGSIQRNGLPAGTYYIIVEGYGTNSGTVNLSVTTTMLPFVIESVSPSSQSILYNRPASEISITGLSGSDGTPITYQWQQSVNNVNWTNISGATAPGYNPGSPLVKTWYRVMATQSFSTSYSKAIVVNVDASPSTSMLPDQNYIRIWTAAAPVSTADSLMQSGMLKARETTQYFDGLGRPLQTVTKKGVMPTASEDNPMADTVNAKDLVSAMIYDEFGREQHRLLPFASTGNNGLFKTTPFAEYAAFMSSQYNGQGSDSHYGYSQTVFEASPLNRVLEQYAPGENWAGTLATSRHSIKSSYWVNNADDGVRIWKVTDNDTLGQWGNYNSPGAYQAGVLYKNVTEDEHGRQVIEFKDKQGQVVLKKVQLTAGIDDGYGSGHDGWMCTYYIYDDLNNLRCVIQPEGVKKLQELNWNSPSFGGGWGEVCFRYEYDSRNRMIVKKVPGAAEVVMVYDVRDRLVMTQDGNLRNQGLWNYTQYDLFNRPVKTGLLSATNDLNTHWTTAMSKSGDTNEAISYPTAAMLTGTTALSQTFYDDYSWLTAQNITGIDGNYDPVHDSYLYNGNTASNNAFPYEQKNEKDGRTKGMVTGTRTNILGTANYITSVTIYDAKGRPIQTKTINHTGGIDITTTQYSWSGQPITMVSRQQKADGSPTIITTVTKHTYDALGRVTQTAKNIIDNTNNIQSGEKIIAQNLYDELGQMKTKKLGVTGGTALETQNYDYNIRGWLLGVNRDYVNNTQSTSKFGFDLGYDKINNLSGTANYAKAMYNGNITGMTWRGKTGNAEVRRYNYDYDAANRILKGDFTDFTNTANNTAYDIKMGDGTNPNTAYDLNGNILAMSQRGLYNSANVVIDQLSYTYQPGSNKLAKVTDAAIATTGLGDFNDGANGGDDYDYDPNGNLTKDENKSISNIAYNILNLPQTITVSPPSGGVGGGGTITYLYDAAGNKLSKTVNETGQVQKTTQYLGGMIFENNVLQHVATEEGRTRLESGAWKFDYFLKDHLGNVRMMLADNGTVLEETHYYPFGLMQKGISYQNTSAPENKKKFNGIEYATEFDLNMYDAQYRNLDPQIGRFWQIDPRPTDDISLYASMNNNPIRFTDPLGDSVINKDAATKATANAKFDNKKKEYGVAGNETKKQFRASGHSRKEWKDFKNARSASNRADAAYNHTQSSIDNFKRVDPVGFAKANSLRYTDNAGTIHDLDVLVSSGTVTNADRGETLFGINSITGVITNNVLNTTIDMNIPTNSNVLAHELGHGIGIANNPLVYYQAYQALSNPSTYDCQTPSNWNNIITRDAINMQHNYDAKLKSYNQFMKVLQVMWPFLRF